MKRTFCFLLGLMLLLPGTPAAGQAEDYEYGVWLPYWEIGASLPEAESLAGRLDTAVAFACLFDNEDQPLMLEETKDLLSSLRTVFGQTDTTVFLSVVNDIEVAEGQYENKSIDLLKRLFMNEEAMSRHLEALASLIDEYSLGGLELDYENIKKDTELWASYAQFIGRIWAICERDGVRLRVVLPWDAPKYICLPDGPEYTVMCYNLYGYHSGAGPKADFDFLNTTCQLYSEVPGKVRMAFATGGFVWSGNKISAVSQEEAEEILSRADVPPVRDEKSGVLNAIYELDGAVHEIWYADAMTLTAWRDACAAFGYTGFDLFRLGGNDLNDWEAAHFLTQP